jgi:hypothetical protein
MTFSNVAQSNSLTIPTAATSAQRSHGGVRKAQTSAASLLTPSARGAVAA